MSATFWDTATLTLLDPRELLLADNARTIVDLEIEDPDFVASVREHGLQIPIVANPTDDGLLVKDGFRRTMAAILAGHTRVPVIITESTDQAVWERLRDQWVANEHRAGFSAADKAKIVEQMSLFGMTAEQIAAQLNTHTDVVEAGLAVRNSKAAVTALDKHPQLTLPQAAALAELEDDAFAYGQLTDTLAREPEQLDHAVARLRRRRAADHAVAELIAELTEQGVPVVAHSSDTKQRVLHNLYISQDDHTILSADVAAHANCPGHAAIVEPTFQGGAEAIYVCRDWARHGHVDRYSSPSSRASKTERDKVEARRVRINNADWRAARDVRREWLTKLLARKSPPKQVQRFLTETLIVGDPPLRRAMEGNHSYARELLGIAPARAHRRDPLLARLNKANMAQAIMLQLAVVLAAHEASTGVHTWRGPSAADQRYFAALSEWGYTLAPVERLVLDPAADSDQWPELHHDQATSAGAGVDDDSSELEGDTDSEAADEDEDDSEEDDDPEPTGHRNATELQDAPDHDSTQDLPTSGTSAA